MNKYIKKFDDEMNLRGFKESTRANYHYTMVVLMNYLNVRSPEKINLDQIKDFLLNVRKQNGKELSTSAINRHICALRFFYRFVIPRKEYPEALPWRKSPRKLPVYFSQQEIQRMIESLKNIKFKAIFMTIYSTGMRLGELRNLKASDIDSKKMTIHIRNGKGRRDRETILSDHLLQVLRQYWKENKDDKSNYLFVGSRNSADKSALGKKPLSHTSVNYVVKSAAKAAGIKKKLQFIL